ncbi:uncharacterized protein LOC143034134 isoform X2 [Oratosquilla oratoria]
MRVALGLLFLFGIVALTRAAEMALCRCAIFHSSGHGEFMVYELPGIDVPNCRYKHTCQGRCEDEFSQLAANGNLYASVGNTTVGQLLCDEHKWPVHNQMMYLYYDICNGPWRYTGKHSMQLLCCDDETDEMVMCN